MRENIENIELILRVFNENFRMNQFNTKSLLENFQGVYFNY